MRQRLQFYVNKLRERERSQRTTASACADRGRCRRREAYRRIIPKWCIMDLQDCIFLVTMNFFNNLMFWDKESTFRNFIHFQVVEQTTMPQPGGGPWPWLRRMDPCAAMEKVNDYEWSMETKKWPYWLWHRNEIKLRIFRSTCGLLHMEFVAKKYSCIKPAPNARLVLLPVGCAWSHAFIFFLYILYICFERTSNAVRSLLDYIMAFQLYYHRQT